MIRPLRKRHRWMILAIGIMVGALAWAAWWARPEPAIQDQLPAALWSGDVDASADRAGSVDPAPEDHR